MKSYTWQEVAKHNSLDSAWVAVEGKVYDVTKWASKHPGGDEYIKIAAGRDITDLFHSYHPFSKAHEAVLPQYLVGTLANTELNTFKPDSGFYRELRDRVGDYFKKNNLHYKDPSRGLVRLAALIFTMLVTYFIFNNPKYNVALRVFTGIIFGACQALILLQMMHDASHSSIGYNQTWWRVIGRFTMDWVAGASMTSWHHQHVLGHHIYTNIMGVDPDLPMKKVGDLRYLVHRQVWAAVYKFQWLYMPILYGLLAIKFRLQDYTDTFNTETNGAIRVNKQSQQDWALMLGAKAWHVLHRIVFPVVLFGMTWKSMILTYLLTEITTGYYLAFNFQVSHISTEAFFPLDEKFDTDVGKEWAAIQVMTGVDYDHNSKIMAFLCGHLNYQIEHHLFPSVSQYYYPDIAPIVKEVCAKHKIRYNYVPTFAEAIGTHIKFLYNMGNEDTRMHKH